MKSVYHQFIVAGASTAGKSAFSHELVKKFHVMNIPIDPIIEGFEDVFPQLGITHNAPTHHDHVAVCQKFLPFVSRVIRGLDVDNFVIEGFRLPIESLHKEFPELQFFVFGYPNATPEDRLAKCRRYDTTNWTNEMTDEELLKTFAFLIEESKREHELCQRLGIPFFDTTEDYEGTIVTALKQAK